MKPKTCGECRYIRRTSPEQVLLRCDFWCATEYPVKGAAGYVGRDFVLAHGHVGEGEPACPFAMPKEVERGANGLSRSASDTS